MGNVHKFCCTTIYIIHSLQLFNKHTKRTLNFYPPLIQEQQTNAKTVIRRVFYYISKSLLK